MVSGRAAALGEVWTCAEVRNYKPFVSNSSFFTTLAAVCVHAVMPYSFQSIRRYSRTQRLLWRHLQRRFPEGRSQSKSILYTRAHTHARDHFKKLYRTYTLSFFLYKNRLWICTGIILQIKMSNLL